MMTVSLDAADIARVDKNGMYDLAKGFADQLREGKEIAQKASINPELLQGVTHVVVIGMGGSAIAGDLVRCFAQSESPVAISVLRNYELPAFVGEQTLVIASSFSGNTEETLSGLQAALAKGASVICVTSGGQVEQIAKANDLPLVKIPGGMPPRAALGYSLSVLLVIAHALGIVTVAEEAWVEAFDLLDASIAEYADLEKDHEARRIAEQLVDKLPIIYSATGMLETVNVRWRGQIQENAKKMAYGNIFPELNHNEIMGWQSAEPGSVHQQLGVVVLRDGEDNARNQHRMEVTRSLLAERAGSWIEVKAKGEHRLARMLSVICLGDWVSLYLAYLRDVDPTPIQLIDKLKNELAKI